LPDDLPDSIAEGLSFSSRVHTLDSSPNVSNPIVVNTTMNYAEGVREARRQIILKALEKAGGERFEAARILGLHPNNLYRLLREFDLKTSSKREG